MNAVVPLRREEESPVDETRLCAWLAQARPGDTLEYHRGFLIIDRVPLPDERDPDRRRRLMRTGDRAMQLEAKGLVHLVQRRLGRGLFSYLVIARTLPMAKPHALATYVHREAA